jgi:zinc transport system permease protein
VDPLDDFLWRAALGGIGVALLAGPLGCFVVWRRMAYFGAALSHAALLGVALGLLLELDIHAGVLAVCVLASVALYVLDRRPEFASDTLLGILAHASLAAGLVMLSFLDQVRVDLTGYLFGDVLALRPGDLAWIWGGGAVCLAALAALWRPLLALTVHEDLARVEGLAVERLRFAFLLLVSAVVALAMQVVGLLLTVSLLILPAAAARRIARSPEGMAAWAALAGSAAVLTGLYASLTLDTPAGPSIVLAGTALFALSGLVRVRV